MNTLANISAAISAIWLSVFGFLTLEVDALGYGALGLGFLFIARVWVGALDDWTDIRERPRLEGMRPSSWYAVALVLGCFLLAILEAKL